METRPTLLVLAASTYQVPFIKAAKRNGCRVVTLDNRPENPGHRLADASLHCDTTDTGAVLQAARRLKIDGVLAAATDVALDSAARISAELGLPGPTMECSHVLTRKIEFRRLQAALLMRHPAFSASPDAIAFPPPWIIKPNRASGSKGIRIVDSLGDLEDAWQHAEAVSVDGRALAESFILGHQGTFEGVIQGGCIAASMATERSTARAPAVGTRGHRVPAGLAPEEIVSLAGQIEQVFSRLGYAEGPFDADFVIGSDGQPLLIELTPRAGGNSLVKLLHYAAGFDMPRHAVQTALGKAPRISPFDVTPTALEILSVDTPGKLAYHPDALSILRTMAGVRHVEIDAQPGIDVRSFVDGRDRLGEIVVSADTNEDLEERLAAALRVLQLRTT